MWQYKQFEELNSRELYQILQERAKVFIVEQASAYLDIDSIDLNAIHVIKRQKNDIKAYARIYRDNKKLKIGRVLVPEQFRSEGHGKELIKIVLAYITAHHPTCQVEIQAEAYLKDFYESFGFETVSDVYFDCDIAHYDMQLLNKEPILQN